MEIRLTPCRASIYVRKYGIQGQIRDFYIEYLGLEHLKENISLIDFIILEYTRPDFKNNNRKCIKKLIRGKGSKLKETDFKIMYDFVKNHPKSNSCLEYYQVYFENPEEEYSKRLKKCDSCSKKRYQELYGETWEIYYEELIDRKRISRENFVKKYGEEEGNRRFDSLCERNRGNHSLERKIELFGEEEGLKRYEKCKLNLKNKHSLENLIRLHGEEEGVKRREQLCKKHSEYAKNAPNAVWRKGTEQYKRWRETMRKLGDLETTLEELELMSYGKYRRRCIRLTEKRDISQLPNYEKRAHPKDNKEAYALDHKISIRRGYELKIKPEIISHLYNLQIIPHKQNGTKGTKCYSFLNCYYDKIDINDNFFKYLEEVFKCEN